MPWQAKDVKKHNKAAKTAADKRYWSTVANKVLNKTNNDASAIRIANAAIRRRKTGR